MQQRIVGVGDLVGAVERTEAEVNDAHAGGPAIGFRDTRRKGRERAFREVHCGRLAL
jgi:hypothetical protein